MLWPHESENSLCLLPAASDTSPALERISKMAEWDRQQRARVEERSKLGLGKKGSSKSISFTERERDVFVAGGRECNCGLAGLGVRGRRARAGSIIVCLATDVGIVHPGFLLAPLVGDSRQHGQVAVRC